MRVLALAGALALLACGPDRYEARGVVRAVRAPERQVTIEHSEVEGLMPAMTMSFDVADPALLTGLEPGRYVEFSIEKSGSRFAITALEAPGASEPGVAGLSGGAQDPLAASGDRAPDFALVDQDERPVSLAALRGKVVLLDFVFTRCPGPCPILTGILRDVREGLSPADRERVQVVSITLDPEHDTPAVLREYAEKRRIDAQGWSFATGAARDVDALARAYGVGSVRQANGEIEHTVATFLIDRDGQIARRYLGTTHEPDAIRADVRELL
jgi:protein SCO1